MVPFLWLKLRWKRCLFETSEILALFVNTLTADDKYSSYKRQKFPQEIESQLFKNQRSLMHFSWHFCHLHQIFNILKKKIKLIAQLYPLVLTPKGNVT